MFRVVNVGLSGQVYAEMFPWSGCRRVWTLKMISSCTSPQSSESTRLSSMEGPLSTDAVGLKRDALAINGISIGFFPAYGEDDAAAIQKCLPAPMAIVGDFVQISNEDMSMVQIDYHLNDVLSLPGPAVYAPALMPMSGLANFNTTQADQIARKMLELNQKGLTVWLRFGHEMNGDWYPYGRKPREYVTAWRLLAQSLKSIAHPGPAKTYLLWAPNVSDSADGIEGYKQYWPGGEYVDLVGLSLYVYDDYNRVAPSDSFTSRFDKFYKLYGTKERKPVTLAETSAPYRFYAGSDNPLPGPDSEVEMKLSWIEQISNPKIASKYPLLNSIVWFNYKKDEDGQRRDFRAFLGRPEVANAFAHFLNDRCSPGRGA